MHRSTIPLWALVILIGLWGLLQSSGGAEEQQPVHVSQLLYQRPIGLLGKPLGERVMIEGNRAERVLMANPIAVVKVDGQALPERVKLELSGIDEIKTGVTYKLEGYESGAFVGPPQWLVPNVQQPFQYRAKFVVTRVIEPTTMPAPGSAKPDQSRSVDPPVGRLGYRIGTYLTITGVRAEAGKVGVHTLLVDQVGDTRIDKPVPIWVDNVEFPIGQRCTLKGYETGSWIGVPPEVLHATGANSDSDSRALPQATWQFHFTFVATSVEQPNGLKPKW